MVIESMFPFLFLKASIIYCQFPSSLEVLLGISRKSKQLSLLKTKEVPDPI